jgi:cytochrome oxidase Cu insertion factor (SCO1/SenC/PrrC family)
MGVFFIGMGILQAWPGRGFWSGRSGPDATAGTLTTTVRLMARLPQPSVLASWVRAFGSFDADHGWAVNLVVVVLLIAIGGAFVSGRPPLLRLGVLTGAGLCLADWVLVQDFGFLGGVGTDPNSMIPMAVVFTAGYLAVVRAPTTAVLPAPVPVPASEGATVPVAAGTPAPVPAGTSPRLAPSYLVRTLAAVGAVGIVLLGVAPMARAAVNPTADAIVSEAADGTPNFVDIPAAPFSLTDQTGRPVSLHSLSGHVVVLTFLDPVCTTDCPFIAQELRLADQMLGADAARVDMVAVVNNPLYNAPAFTAAFDRQEGLDSLPNWIFLTGSLDELHNVWNDYGEQSAVSPAGAMVAHSDIVYIIDGSGRTREILDADPGGATSASESSFSGLVAGLVRTIVPS